MKIGCHAVLYREAVADRTDEVLGEIATTGCDAVEVGSRFFSADRAPQLRDALARARLELSGLHAVVPLSQLLDDPDAAQAGLDGPARVAASVPSRNLICTGMIDMASRDDPDLGDPRLQDPAALETLARRLDEITVRLADRYGARLRYHNHNWEFAHESAIYTALMEHAPHVTFALDTGWAAVSGVDPVALVESEPARFGYFHLRDMDRARAAAATTQDELSASYPEFGQGDLDVARLLRAVAGAAGTDGYAVVEYEWGPQDPERYRRAVDLVRSLTA